MSPNYGLACQRRQVHLRECFCPHGHANSSQERKKAGALTAHYHPCSVTPLMTTAGSPRGVREGQGQVHHRQAADEDPAQALRRHAPAAQSG